MDTTGQKATADTRKPRRSRPDLGALSSLVSFDGPEAEDRKTEMRNSVPLVGSKAASSSHEDDHDFTRMVSVPELPSTLVRRGVPSVRKTLSQDWLKIGFSPRPGKEPKKELLWGSDCVRSPQRLLSNLPSLRSIPEENELDGEEGSELSDDNVPPATVSRPTLSDAQCAGEIRDDDEVAAPGREECLREESADSVNTAQKISATPTLHQ